MAYRPIKSIDVASIPQPGFNVPDSINFSSDGNLLTYFHSWGQSLPRKLFAYDLQTDREHLYPEPDRINEAIETNFSFEENLHRERQRLLLTSIIRYQWSKNKAHPIMLLLIGYDLYVYDNRGIHLLTNGSRQSPILDPKLSPDGKLVAFVNDCEIHCASTDISTQLVQPRRLTFDARHCPNKMNGLAEFIAHEEMDRTDGFWWSDDSRFIAFTQVDESNVPPFRISHSGHDEPDLVEEHRYPFTGKRNVLVIIGIIDLTLNNNEEQSDIHWVDLSQFHDYYVARVGFFPDNSLALQIENRQQTKLQLFQYDFINRKPLKLLIEETNDIWINLHDLFRTLKQTPTKFIWGSERSGFMHLELHDYATGQLIKTLTQGDWVVENIVDIDETNSIIYFTGNRETPLEFHLYSVNYQDETPTVDRITQESGFHVVYCFNQTHQYCITQWSSIEQHPLIRMIDVKTKEVIKNFEHLEQRILPTIEQFDLVKPKLFSILNRNKDRLYCALYTPNNEHGRYRTPFPTLVSVYGGPRVQRVVNSWLLRSDMRCQRLVKSGYVVFCLDNRGSLNRGLAFESPIKHDMGHLELEDQIDGVQYLIDQGITDKARVGIFGWSYGGYMSAMAMVRGNDTFKLGIAGAPVTHWDGYDTHYTERYMGTPDENPNGYTVSSVLHHVHNLKGHLMIIHGLIDENVHFRHSARLVNALIKAQKPYELVLFPDERHMPGKLHERIYMEERLFEFIRKYL